MKIIYPNLRSKPGFGMILNLLLFDTIDGRDFHRGGPRLAIQVPRERTRFILAVLPT
jgi:hypothetical protein